MNLYRPRFSDETIFVIKRPFRPGVQSVLVVFVQLSPIYLIDAVYPVEKADFLKLGPAERFFDSRYLGAVLYSTSATHAVLTKKESDALRRLKYVAAGGTDAFLVPELDTEVWRILSWWQDWKKRDLGWKQMHDEFCKRTGKQMTATAFEHRCTRMGLQRRGSTASE